MTAPLLMPEKKRKGIRNPLPKQKTNDEPLLLFKIGRRIMESLSTLVISMNIYSNNFCGIENFLLIQYLLNLMMNDSNMKVKLRFKHSNTTENIN